MREDAEGKVGVAILDVSRDTLIRIVRLPSNLDLIKRPVFKVSFCKVLCHPVAPLKRQAILEVASEDKDRNTDDEGSQPLEEHLCESISILF